MRLSKKTVYIGITFLFLCMMGYQIQKGDTANDMKNNDNNGSKTKTVSEQDIDIMKKYLGYVQRDIYYLYNRPLFADQDEWSGNEYTEISVEENAETYYIRKLGDRDIWLLYSEISTDAYFYSPPENVVVFQYLEEFPLSKNIGRSWEEVVEEYPEGVKSMNADSSIWSLRLEKDGLAFDLVFEKEKKAVEYIRVTPLSEKARFQAYEIVKRGEGDYRYKIYDETGRLAESGTKAGTEPIITYISETVLELRLSAGMYSNVRYFNIKNGKSSETYSDPVYVDEDLVAYMSYQDDKMIHLILRSLFDREKLYLDVNLNFYPTARPYDCLNKLERTGDNQFLIFYRSTDENGELMDKKAVIEVDYDSNTWKILHEI